MHGAASCWRLPSVMPGLCRRRIPSNLRSRLSTGVILQVASLFWCWGANEIPGNVTGGGVLPFFLSCCHSQCIAVVSGFDPGTCAVFPRCRTTWRHARIPREMPRWHIVASCLPGQSQRFAWYSCFGRRDMWVASFKSRHGGESPFLFVDYAPCYMMRYLLPTAVGINPNRRLNFLHVATDLGGYVTFCPH